MPDVDGTTLAQFGTDENGMGIDVGDVDNDGWLDVFVTAIFDPLQSCQTGNCGWGYSGNRLYRYAGSRVFQDWTDLMGCATAAGAGVRGFSTMTTTDIWTSTWRIPVPIPTFCIAITATKPLPMSPVPRV